MDKPTTLNISFIVHTPTGCQTGKLRHRIGLAYLPGALPCFEEFGKLPTDLVREEGLVAGKPASEALDMLIIPGGSLVESNTCSGKIHHEILKMADAGKLVLGICSGFQILSKGTDIGRLSSTPIWRDGLGLIDAEFSPLICTDQVSATVVATSYLTDKVGAQLSGFHCHTYGKIALHKSAKAILVSQVNRLNYRKNPQELISGISNKEGNVIGIILHALLDQNPVIIQGIAKSLCINSEELAEIREANASLQNRLKSEIGISTNILASSTKAKAKTVNTLFVTALGSGSGKTVIVAALSSALKKRGINVGVVKVGGDIRDLVPSLYLIKQPIKSYSSIKIGESGWKKASEAIKQASKDYDFLIIEGAMSAFTGLLMDKTQRPSSSAEVAAMLGTPTILVVGGDKEGVEGAMVGALSYVKLMRNLGIKIKGIILNKMLLSYLTEEIRQVVNCSLSNVGVELFGIVPRMNLEGRGTIPEIEIRYEEFGAKAIEIAETYLDIDRILQAAGPVMETPIDSNRFLERFKKALEKNYRSNTSEGWDQKACS